MKNDGSAVDNRKIVENKSSVTKLQEHKGFVSFQNYVKIYAH